MSIDPHGVRISGPLEQFGNGYASELDRLGYAPASVRLQLKVFADLSDWLLRHGADAACLNLSELDRFLSNRRAVGHSRYASPKAIRPSLIPSLRSRHGIAEYAAAAQHFREPPHQGQ